jgi:histidinol-phosphatase (PHP family)
MLVSYHVHSRWSDGKAEIEEMIRAAADAGLDEIGLSDHYVLTPSRSQLDWSMPLDRLDEYVDAVQTAAGTAPDGLLVRLGVEADFIPETAADLRDILASQPFDYVIGSVHIVDGFTVDSTPSAWDPISQPERNEILRAYWVRVRQMAESGLFDFAGHLDLPKKFGIRATVDLSDEISAALDAIAVAGMAVEVNTAGWYWTCDEPYPSERIIRGCLQRDIPILVPSDAHVPENIVRGYERAFALLREAGCRETVNYAGRQRLSVPL